MKEICINLKRFDIPARAGGICPSDNPGQWIEQVMEQSALLAKTYEKDVRIMFLLPENLLIPATLTCRKVSSPIAIGSQGVFREDVSPGGNFGAFTTNLPASAAYASGATWTIIGHSEERKNLLHLLSYTMKDAIPQDMECVKKGVHEILNQEVKRAYEAGLNVLYCVGETAEEQGDGTDNDKQNNLKAVLAQQIGDGLEGIQEYTAGNRLILAYEPIWSIGPGKTPASPEYVRQATMKVKEIAEPLISGSPKVIYGGGLKAENSKALGSLDILDGGLIALTRFTPPIGFSVEDLGTIIELFLEGSSQ